MIACAESKVRCCKNKLLQTMLHRLNFVVLLELNVQSILLAASQVVDLCSKMQRTKDILTKMHICKIIIFCKKPRNDDFKIVINMMIFHVLRRVVYTILECFVASSHFYKHPFSENGRNAILDLPIHRQATARSNL